MFQLLVTVCGAKVNCATVVMPDDIVPAVTKVPTRYVLPLVTTPASEVPVVAENVDEMVGTSEPSTAVYGPTPPVHDVAANVPADPIPVTERAMVPVPQAAVKYTFTFNAFAALYVMVTCSTEVVGFEYVIVIAAAGPKT